MSDKFAWIGASAFVCFLIIGIPLILALTIGVPDSVEKPYRLCREGAEALGHMEHVVLDRYTGGCEIAVTGQPAIHIVFPQEE